MSKGRIYKSLSGFYYIDSDDGLVTCKARGKFRRQGITPLVGDEVEYTVNSGGEGVVEAILPRKNEFIRPPVANIDLMVIFVSEAVPITEPFLIDRVVLIAESKGCEPVICINKTDLAPGDTLYDIYKKTGITVVRTSAADGRGVDELRSIISGKVCAFTGNSGVGKSSILNLLEPGFEIAIGEVSQRLGRGRHTTRHVELFKLSCKAEVADTPGFSSFDTERMEFIRPEEVQFGFREFTQYSNHCRFLDCAHVAEPGCGILEAVAEGKIDPSRHKSYVRLYEQAKSIKEWEIKDKK